MAEHIAEVLVILGFFVSLLIGIIKWIFKKTVKELEEEKRQRIILEQKHHNLEVAFARLQTEIAEDFADIKTNYIKRFDEIIEKLNAHHEESIKDIGKIILSLEKQQQFCQFIQEQKKINNDKTNTKVDSR